MYSLKWFATFADQLDPAITAADVSAIRRICPPSHFPDLLEVGCGTGRVAARLAERGYRVLGIDINEEALHFARTNAPGPAYVALDQRQLGQMPWKFDAVVLLWNSLGFTTRDDDATTLSGVARVLRPGGRLLVDLYHPEWLADQPNGVTTDARGAQVSRWLERGRLHHNIVYANGVVDDIQFNVYSPRQFIELAEASGLQVVSQMTWWSTEKPPRRECARYQLELQPNSPRIPSDP